MNKKCVEKINTCLKIKYILKLNQKINGSWWDKNDFLVMFFILFLARYGENFYKI